MDARTMRRRQRIYPWAVVLLMVIMSAAVLALAFVAFVALGFSLID